MYDVLWITYMYDVDICCGLFTYMMWTTLMCNVGCTVDFQKVKLSSMNNELENNNYYKSINDIFFGVHVVTTSIQNIKVNSH